MSMTSSPLVLGLNCFHSESSACLVSGDEVLCAIQEERLGERIKSSAGFPIESIKYVLEYVGATLADVDSLALPSSPSVSLIEKIKYGLVNMDSIVGPMRASLTKWQKSSSILQRVAECNGNVAQNSVRGVAVSRVEHHLSHVASGFYSSNFQEAMAFTFDGSGDFVSATIADCNERGINIIKRVYLPHSLGILYTAVCQFIGYTRYGEEYKVMGLSAYGRPDKYRNAFNHLVRYDIRTDSYKINHRYIRSHFGRSFGDGDGKTPRIATHFTPEISRLFNTEPLRREENQSEVAKNIAAALQEAFTKVAYEFLFRNLPKKHCGNLVLSGGCALNGLFVGELVKSRRFDAIHLHSASGDEGTALGAAIYTSKKIRGTYSNNRESPLSPYLGASIENAEGTIRQLSSDHGYNLGVFPEELIAKSIASDILADYVVGMFHGRSEWGARALGNRSILANAFNPEMKQIINQKIKRRESFRPFAPAVLQEDQPELFGENFFSPYMTHVLPFKAKFRKTFPSVTHVDYTGRVQTVSQEINPRFFEILHEIKVLRGVGICLNTSFNENEPIVETLEQAFQCFHRTGMDVVYLGNYRMSRG